MKRKESIVLMDITKDINFLMHYGVSNTNWYVHKYGDWERHAKYANGMPNPETAHIGRGRTDYNPKYMNRRLKKDEMPSTGEMIVSSIKDSINERRISKAPVDERTGLHLKTHDISRDADMKRVNPGLKNGQYQTQYNCSACTYAYEMRRRGYDVAANANYESGFPREYMKYFKNQKQVPIVAHSVLKNGSPEMKKWQEYKQLACKGRNHAAARQTLRALKAQGNARGNLILTWGAGDGHSVVYEVDHGKVTLRDCQLGKKLNPYDTLSRCVTTGYIRLDTLDFDPRHIKGAVH